MNLVRVVLMRSIILCNKTVIAPLRLNWLFCSLLLLVFFFCCCLLASNRLPAAQCTNGGSGSNFIYITAVAASFSRVYCACCKPTDRCFCCTRPNAALPYFAPFKRSQLVAVVIIVLCIRCYCCYCLMASGA